MGRSPTDAEYVDFVHLAWPRLYRTAYLLLGDHALAEDLVQTTLTKTYVSWGRVRDHDAAHRYARTTMVNTAASWFRRRSWRRELPSDSLPEGHYVEDAAARPALLAALRQLPPRQRAVVVLRYYEELSVRETAAALGVSDGTVKSQTSAALERLRSLLGDSVVEVGEGAVS
jgi:RNA polymerase sigma-70 factor (sigma-E family)